MAIRNGLQGCLEISVGLDVVDLAGFNEGANTAPVSATFAMTCKKGILAIERNGADGALDNVAIHFNGTVREEDISAQPSGW